MKPSVDLARSLAAAVLDQVERDKCLNSDRLTEALLARMLVTDAMPDVASQAAPLAVSGSGVHHCARVLVAELKHWIGGGASNVPWGITSAGIDLEKALRREGWL